MIQRLKGSERVTPDRINRLIEDVERQTKISLGRGLVGSSTSAGVTIANAMLSPPPQDHDIIFNDAGAWGTAHDTDEYGILGRAAIGYNGTDADRACFAHIDHRDNTSYALMQNNDGKTYLNCDTGHDITFRINDVEKMKIDATDLRYVPGTDGVAIFGEAHIGYNGTDAGAACFGEAGMMNSTNYALMQDVGGSVHLNAPGGKVITFSINDVSYASMSMAVAFFDVNIAANNLWAAHFARDRAAATVGVVKIVQDHDGGTEPCLELKQDDVSEGFIDFQGSDRGVITGGTNSVGSVRVEIGGVKGRLAVYADA